MNEPPVTKLGLIRSAIGRRSAASLLAAVVVLVISLVALSMQFQRVKPPIGNSYFYDLETSQLFPADDTHVPPILAPSGKRDANGRPTGVRAHVFSTGDCSETEKRFIGYLEIYTPEGQAALEARMVEVTGGKPVPTPPWSNREQDPVFTGRMLSVPGSGQWVQAISDEGMRIVDEAKSRTPNPVFSSPCLP